MEGGSWYLSGRSVKKTMSANLQYTRTHVYPLPGSSKLIKKCEVSREACGARQSTASATYDKLKTNAKRALARAAGHIHDHELIHAKMN